MTSQKRCAIVFLGIINIINIAAGIITELQMILGKDVVSVIPITAELSVNQILNLNFAVVVTVMTLISIVTTYLATDVPYSPKEILSNCAGIFLIIPVAVLAMAVFNAINAPITADKFWIVAGAVYYFLTFVVNVGCILTIRYDAE